MNIYPLGLLLGLFGCGCLCIPLQADARPTSRPVTKVQAKPPQVFLSKGRIWHPKIHFDIGKPRIKRKSYPIIKRITALLRKDPTLFVLVQYHMDQKLAKYYRHRSYQLDRRRAQSVRRMMIYLGVSAERINAVGCGGDRPLVREKHPQDRIKNRRIELHTRRHKPTTTSCASKPSP